MFLLILVVVLLVIGIFGIGLLVCLIDAWYEWMQQI